MILQGVRCRADVALSGWFLGDDNIHKPLINRTAASHLCVNWDSVENWLKPRALDWKNGAVEGAITPRGHMSHHDMMHHAKYH